MSILQKNVKSENEKKTQTLQENLLEEWTQINKEVSTSFVQDYSSVINDNFSRIRKVTEGMAEYMSFQYQNQSSAGNALTDVKYNGIAYLPNVDAQSLQEEINQVLGICDYIRTIPDYDEKKLDELDYYVVLENGACLDGTGKNYKDSDYSDLRTTEWYEGASKSGEAYWSDVFTGSVTGIKKITCAVPFYDGQGTLKGVAAADIAVDQVYNTVFNVKTEQLEHAFLLSNDDEIMVNPDNYDVEGLISTNEEIKAIFEQNDKISVVATEQGVIACAPIQENNCKLGFVFSFNKIMDTANMTVDEVKNNNQAISDRISSRTTKCFVICTILVLILICINIPISRKFTNNLVRSLKQLESEALYIGEGHFDRKITDIHTGDEIQALAESFNVMMDKLSDYMKNLEQVTADKERIATELDVATKIQASMLPCIFPPFPNRKEIDIYASMNPAKEVGGDFYDFFMVDDYHLAIVVADVSGKGVPAALFMVIGKTLLKDHTRPGISLGQVFMEVNNILCGSNEEGLFITAFEAVLDLRTGEMEYVNAGHELPFICKKNGEYKPVKIKAAFVLAGMEDMKYHSEKIQLESGDKIFQYTDGVTEATNAKNELFGMERLEEALNKKKDAKVAETLTIVRDDIDAFVKEAPQFDDITMLCLEFKEQS